MEHLEVCGIKDSFSAQELHGIKNHQYIRVTKYCRSTSDDSPYHSLYILSERRQRKLRINPLIRYATGVYNVALSTRTAQHMPLEKCAAIYKWRNNKRYGIIDEDLCDNDEFYDGDFTLLTNNIITNK